MPSGSVPPFLLMFLPFSSSQKTYPFFNPLGQFPFLKIQYWPKGNIVYIENWPIWREQFETVDKERKRNNMTHKFGIWKYPRLYFVDFGLLRFASDAIFYKTAPFFSTNGILAVLFPVVLGDFGFDVTCQACRENSRYRARFQASSGHSDSANRPGYEVGILESTTHLNFLVLILVLLHDRHRASIPHASDKSYINWLKCLRMALVGANGLPYVGKSGFCLCRSWISLTVGIQNRSSTDKDWNPVPGIRNPQRGSRIQDFLGFPCMGENGPLPLYQPINGEWTKKTFLTCYKTDFCVIVLVLLWF